MLLARQRVNRVRKFLKLETVRRYRCRKTGAEKIAFPLVRLDLLVGACPTYIRPCEHNLTWEMNLAQPPRYGVLIYKII